MKLNEGIAQFEVQLKAEGRSKHTISSYLRDLRYLTGYVGENCDIANITIEVLNQALTSEPVTMQSGGQPKSPVSINKTKTSFKSFFRFLYVSKVILFNPADSIRIKHYERKVPEILTDQEKKILFKRLNDSNSPRAFRDRVIYNLLLNTGIRLMESVELNIGDINIYEKRMSIIAKGNQQATKFLNTRIRRELERYLRIRRRMVVSTNALFLSTRSQRISSRQVQRSFQQWLQACGIKKNLTIHSLRHTFASNLYERTNNLVLTQNALGHRNIATTTIYTHLHNDSLVEALEAI